LQKVDGTHHGQGFGLSAASFPGRTQRIEFNADHSTIKAFWTGPGSLLALAAA
jgi:hypothetical protein